MRNPLLLVMVGEVATKGMKDALSFKSGRGNGMKDVYVPSAFRMIKEVASKGSVKYHFF
ncbi:hypothetical protein NCCP133_28980 [Cytobacillus sp. NCCP-133]|nr:hypothetical protein NCCP133_28980 [Cytobacillus sp. NCCP-133]